MTFLKIAVIEVPSGKEVEFNQLTTTGAESLINECKELLEFLEEKARI